MMSSAKGVDLINKNAANLHLPWPPLYLLVPCLFLIGIHLPVIHAQNGQAQNTPLTWTHLSTERGDLPAPTTSTEQTATLILDIDNDGTNDFVTGSRRYGAPSLVWYRRTDAGWAPYLIDDEVLDLEAGGAFFDIDGDGDLDLVFGGDQRSNQVWWWENPYPHYTPTVGWTRREIKRDGERKHHDQLFGDLDGDGQTELVFWNQGGKALFLAEIPADPHTAPSWPYRPIYEWTDDQQEEGLAQADIDGDGLVDIIGGGKWFKYNADGTFTPRVIDKTQRFTRAAAGQLVAGGPPEVVFAAGDVVGPLKWYAWDGTAWHGHDLLPEAIERGHSLQIADLNNDGFLDIFAAEMRLDGENSDAGMWIFLGDGQGNFTHTSVAVGMDNHESRVGDLDNDGALDILGKPFNHDTPHLNIWLNTLITADDPKDDNNDDHACPIDNVPWPRTVVDATAPWRSLFILTGDLDGDGWPDLATGGWWYKNPGVAGSAWSRHAFGTPLNNVAALYDFDGDGDLDALGTQGEGSTANANFAWARNEGNGNFTIFTNIQPAEGNFLQGIAVGRFRNNPTIEVALSWHKASAGVQMLTLPADPATGLWAWRRITTVAQDEDLSAGDIDGDGDLDLLLGTQWLRNDQDIAGGPSAWQPFTLFVTDLPPDRNHLADLSGDGRLDAVVSYERAGAPAPLAWYQQPEVAEAPWIEHVIDHPIGPMSLDVADMDNDGDLDVIIGEHHPRQPAQAKVLIYENLDGRGTQWQAHIINQGDDHHNGTQVADFTGDGLKDIVSIAWNERNVLLYPHPTCATPLAPSPTATTFDSTDPPPTFTPQPATATPKPLQTPSLTPQLPIATPPLSPTPSLTSQPPITTPGLTPAPNLTATISTPQSATQIFLAIIER
jgi:hypothetical protein